MFTDRKFQDSNIFSNNSWCLEWEAKSVMWMFFQNSRGSCSWISRAVTFSKVAFLIKKSLCNIFPSKVLVMKNHSSSFLLSASDRSDVLNPVPKSEFQMIFFYPFLAQILVIFDDFLKFFLTRNPFSDAKSIITQYVQDHKTEWRCFLNIKLCFS